MLSVLNEVKGLHDVIECLTPPQFATFHGHSELAKFLVLQGADKAAHSYEGIHDRLLVSILLFQVTERTNVCIARQFHFQDNCFGAQR